MLLELAAVDEMLPSGAVVAYTSGAGKLGKLVVVGMLPFVVGSCCSDYSVLVDYGCCCTDVDHHPSQLVLLRNFFAANFAEVCCNSGNLNRVV